MATRTSDGPTADKRSSAILPSSVMIVTRSWIFVRWYANSSRGDVAALSPTTTVLSLAATALASRSTSSMEQSHVSPSRSSLHESSFNLPEPVFELARLHHAD